MATRIFEQPINRVVAANIVYPVGSIYMSVNNISPQAIFSGTTWVQLEDRILVAAGEVFEAGETGGSDKAYVTPVGTVGDHTLTTDEIPSHTHGLDTHQHDGGTFTTSTNGSHKHDIYGTYKATYANDGSGQARTLNAATASTTGWESDAIGSGGEHSHTVSGSLNASLSDTDSYGQSGAHNHNFVGIESEINIMPPYLPVYMWKRTA